jgi:phage antirepressor YoqD-like protein
MVDEELMSAGDTAAYLGITLNHLRQIQHRKQLLWETRSGRKVFYRKGDVERFAVKRNDRIGARKTSD